MTKPQQARRTLSMTTTVTLSPTDLVEFLRRKTAPMPKQSNLVAVEDPETNTRCFRLESNYPVEEVVGFLCEPNALRNGYRGILSTEDAISEGLPGTAQPRVHKDGPIAITIVPVKKEQAKVA